MASVYKKNCPIKRTFVAARPQVGCRKWGKKLYSEQERGRKRGQSENRRLDRRHAEGAGADPEGAGPAAPCVRPGGEQVGAGSFPKLKIPHQSHADFCSTDTAGGLDNKKRRYAPRGGVAYRLFLWGFPKGATPPFGTRLCEAKCSVLYALPALP